MSVRRDKVRIFFSMNKQLADESFIVEQPHEDMQSCRLSWQRNADLSDYRKILPIEQPVRSQRRPVSHGHIIIASTPWSNLVNKQFVKWKNHTGESIKDWLQMK